MMFNVVLSPSVEMDKLVIVFVRSVVGFRSGCVAFVVWIGFSLARTNFFLRLAVLNAMIGLSGKFVLDGGSVLLVSSVRL